MKILVVALGGAAGSLLRYGLGVLFQVPGWPIATWMANVLGSFCIGLFYVWGKEAGILTPGWYLLLTTGLMGGFTTFSAFSLEIVEFLLQGHAAKAGLYAGVSLMAGLLACGAGVWLARSLV